MRMILTIPEDKRLVVDLVSHPGEAIIQIVDEPVRTANRSAAQPVQPGREAVSSIPSFRGEAKSDQTTPVATTAAAPKADHQPAPATATSTQSTPVSETQAQPVKRRGRPPGSKNKPKIESASTPTPSPQPAQATQAEVASAPVEESVITEETVDNGPVDVNDDPGLDEPRINPDDEMIEDQPVVTAPRTSLFGTKTAEPASETPAQEATVTVEEKPAEEPAETAPKSLFANFKRVVNEKE